LQVTSVLDEGDDDLPALRGRLLAHEQVVTVEDSVLDHALALDDQAEHLARRVGTEEEAVDADAVDHVLLGEDRLTSRDPPEDRHLDLARALGRRPAAAPGS
jgi:hypothetical protein